MDANLVGSAGLYDELDQTVPAAELPQDFPVSDRVFSGDKAYCHFLAIDRMATDGSYQPAAFFPENAMQEGDIFFRHSSVFETVNKSPVDNILFGHQHYAGSIFIESVHDAGT